MENYWLQEAAVQGDDYALNSLGYNYLNGIYVEKDSAMAVRYFLKAVKKKNEEAANNLAICYEDGDGVEKNLREALRWYRLADKWCKEGMEGEIARVKELIKAEEAEKKAGGNCV